MNVVSFRIWTLVLGLGISGIVPDIRAADPAVVLPPEVGELDLRFRQLLKERVSGAYAADLGKLDAGYLGGVERLITAAQTAGDLDAVLALEAEKKRVEQQAALPAEDEETIPVQLKELRVVYREQLAKLAAARAANLKALVDPLEARLVQMETDFTKGGRLDDAKAVRVYRVELGEEVVALGLPSVANTAVSPIARSGLGSDLEGKEAGELREIGGIEMVWCPPGSFTMGSPDDEAGRLSDEGQVKTRISRGFWLAKTETTQKQWEKVMKTNPSYYKGDDLPVEEVSWIDAQAFFAEWQKLDPLPEGWKWSLPTEAQWEYACRAGTRTAFHVGEKLDGKEANQKISERPDSGGAGKAPTLTMKVGSYEPNAWGLHDMHGNVREWCQDWHASTLAGGTDPAGPASGSIRIRRGGSWNHEVSACRSASRHKGPADDKNSDLGLRPALVRVTP